MISDAHIVLDNYKKKMEKEIQETSAKLDVLFESKVKRLHEAANKELQDLYENLVDWQTLHETLQHFFEKHDWGKTLGLPYLRTLEVPVLGIDLGTKNCVVAIYMDKNVEIVKFAEDKSSVPSYVLIDSNGDPAFGEEVKRYAYENRENTIYDSKRMIGRNRTHISKFGDNKYSQWPFKVYPTETGINIAVNGEIYVPEDISGMLLKYCKEAAEAHAGVEITKAVITVPAYFDDAQRRATMKAARKAGLQLIKLLSEPVAAAISYNVRGITTSKKYVLVFDIGGGTFDLAAVEIKENTMDVIALGGDAYLGGADIDDLLVMHCIEKFCSDTGNRSDDVMKQITGERQWDLLEACEKAKVKLSKMNTAKIAVQNFYLGNTLSLQITRSEFEAIIEDLANKMINMVKDTIKEAKKQTSLKDKYSIFEVSQVLLIGGSTKIPLLNDKLREFFGSKVPLIQKNPDTSVAYGAAVEAALLTSERSKAIFELEVVRDILALPIGIMAVIDGVSGKFQKIIEKSTKYPCCGQQLFRTTEDDQDIVKIQVYQGEAPMAIDNKFIGAFELRGIPMNRKGAETIEVKMKIGHEGVLVVTASCRDGFNSLEICDQFQSK